MSDTPLKNIALLIDADNVSPTGIDPVLTVLAELGQVNIRRAYGNWAKSTLAKWAHHDHSEVQLRGERQDLSLDDPIEGVVRNLNAVNSARRHDALQLIKRVVVIMRSADPANHPFGSPSLELRQALGER